MYVQLYVYSYLKDQRHLENLTKGDKLIQFILYHSAILGLVYIQLRARP